MACSLALQLVRPSSALSALTQVIPLVIPIAGNYIATNIAVRKCDFHNFMHRYLIITTIEFEGELVTPRFITLINAIKNRADLDGI